MLIRNHFSNFLITLIIFPACMYAAPAPININTATAQELDEALPDVGPTRAEVIVSYRDKHGPFKSLENLDDVPGIGPKMLEAMSGLIQFGDAVNNNDKPATPPAATSKVIDSKNGSVAH